jgi:hypothetical protein
MQIGIDFVFPLHIGRAYAELLDASAALTVTGQFTNARRRWWCGTGMTSRLANTKFAEARLVPCR